MRNNFCWQSVKQSRLVFSILIIEMKNQTWLKNEFEFWRDEMTDNAARVIRIIAQQLGKQESKIKLTDKFIEDLSADSLDIVELIMALEDEFGTKIPDDEAELLTTVGAAIEYVENKISKGEAQ